MEMAKVLTVSKTIDLVAVTDPKNTLIHHQLLTEMEKQLLISQIRHKPSSFEK